METKKEIAVLLQESLRDTGDLQAFLDQLSEIAAAELAASGADYCSVTLERPRRGVTVASSDPEAAVWDELQYAEEDGPCLEAARTGSAVISDDLWSEDRWRSYVSQIRGHGPRSLIAAPIPLQGEADAALTCYSGRQNAFADDDRLILSAVAAAASCSFKIALRLAAESELSADLEAALGSRTVINLAPGIIMGQSRCTRREAMASLVRASNHRNRKLRDVALEIVCRYDPQVPLTHFD